MTACTKIVLICLLLSGCSQQIVTHFENPTTGAFTEVNSLERNLKRGVSTKSDVRQVLGAPMGSGNAVFPTDPTAREVWFYQDIQLTDIKGLEQIIRINVRQQILLVFFKKEVLDGFMWYSNVVPGTGKSQ
ncbi:MAG TPA: hypothetical protein VF905_04700 [Nitrospirota bacterium]|jgi:outer membrane protein assembly factor BamE (lipoprotein component of BamABCDE complex)